MENYRLAFKKSVTKDLLPLPKREVAKILACIESLAKQPRPRGSEKLSEQERYRVRQGVYRIIYEIQDDLLLVTVVKVGHRSNVYRSS
jgi:mRNA interferase RelE/StbE